MTIPINLTHRELLSHAHISHDPLTGTELEAELLSRLELTVDELDELDPISRAIHQSEFDVTEVAELFAVLEEFSASDLKSLRQKLKRADDFFTLAEEAGDLFTRLAALQATTV